MHYRLGLLAFLSVLTIPAPRADAPKPEIKAHTPRYMRAGRTITLTLYGDNLAPDSVTAGKSEVTVKLIGTKPTEGAAKAQGSLQVTLEVTAPRHITGNAVDLTLTQPGGAKATLGLPVLEDVAAEMPAKKPNGSYAQAMPLPGPSVGISGALESDTPATFRFEAKAGEVWDFVLLAGRVGSALDAVMRVRDDRHLSLALSAGNPKIDRQIHFRAPATAPYYLEIGDDQARSGPTFTYVLTAIRRP